MAPALRPLVPKLVACFMLAATAAGARAEDWPGWRGPGGAGRSESKTAPTHWSATENVAWQLELPGQGHSSPVVHGGDVFVTVARVRQDPAGAGPLLVDAKVGMTLLVVCFGVVAAARRAGRSPAPGTALRRYLAAVFVGVVIVLLTGLVVFGDEALDFERCEIRRWIGSTVAVGLCVVLAGAVLPPGSVARRLVGVAALGFAAWVLAGVPNKEHAYRTGYLGAQAMVMYLVSAVPGAAGAWLLLSRRKPAEAGNPSDYLVRGAVDTSVRLALVAVGIVSVLAAAASAGWFAVSSSEYLTYHLGRPRCEPVVPWPVVHAFAATVAVALVVGILLSSRRPVPRRVLPRAMLALVPAALAVAHFTEVNYAARAQRLVRGIVCVDRRTGTIRWVCEGLEGPGAMTDQNNSPASPTAAVDGARVVAYFGSAGLMCAGRDGKLLWERRDLPYESIYGVGTSPVLHDGVVVVASEQPSDPYVAAVDAKAGEVIWRAARTASRAHVSGNSRVPVVADIGGRPAVLVWGFADLSAYDLHTGEVLAALEAKSIGDQVCSPVSDGAVAYLADPTRVRAITLPQRPSARVAKKAELRWDRRLRGPNVTSPVVCGGLVFCVSDSGQADCLDAVSGEVLWEERLSGQYFSSPVAAGGFIYFTNSDGHTSVWSCERAPKLVAENDLGEPVYASHAVVDGRLFIRTTDRLYCIAAADMAASTPTRQAP